VRKKLYCRRFGDRLLIVPAGFVTDKLTSVCAGQSRSVAWAFVAKTWTLTQAFVRKRLWETVAGIQNFGGNLGGILAPALTGYLAHVTNSFALPFCRRRRSFGNRMFSYWFLIQSEVDLLISLNT